MHYNWRSLRGLDWHGLCFLGVGPFEPRQREAPSYLEEVGKQIH